MSRPGASMSILGAVQTGSRSTETGVSHSCDRPTRRSSPPRAQTISVALAMSETTRAGRAAVTPSSLILLPHPGPDPAAPDRERRGQGADVKQIIVDRGVQGRK